MLFFLAQVFLISLSGALSPGPVTAAAITSGARSKYAGSALALGHALVELPVMVLVMLGMNRLFGLPLLRCLIGFFGGSLLLNMAIDMFKTFRRPASGGLSAAGKSKISSRPVITGMVLSVSNPYFLLWWTTVGLALVAGARRFGAGAFGLFALVHWLCDWGWLQFLSWAGFKGLSVFGPVFYRWVMLTCSIGLGFFGILFIYNSVVLMVK